MSVSTESFPHYTSLILDMGLKDRAANSAYRRKMIKACNHGQGEFSAHSVQSMVKQRCAKDILYFCNVFCWVFEPRDIEQNDNFKVLPFITFDFQDRLIGDMRAAWGKKDIDILKSREQGLTWIALLFAAHDFVFGEMSSGQLVSRKQDLVDKTGEQDTLFWKLMFLIEKLPVWMRPKYTKTFMSLVNEDTGYVITGASTTGDVGRGGRKRWIILDEYAAFSIADSYSVDASTQHNTRCRVRISTPQGAYGAFYDCFQKVDSPSLQIRSHWSEHPYKKPGMYTSEGGHVKLIDVSYWLDYEGSPTGVIDEPTLAKRLVEDADGYDFVLDGKVRSPWYDFECKRATRAWLIAQELDMDFLGSGNQYFDSAFLGRVASMCLAPMYVGEIEYDSDSCIPSTFTEREGGRVKLWCQLDPETGKPSEMRTYVSGADIAQGTGASSSALIVIDSKTGEQVAEVVANKMSPDAFARLCVAVCRFFGGYDGRGSKLSWEANGPGRAFGNKVLELDFNNIYYRRKEDLVMKTRTEIPGWYSTRETKQGLFGDFAAALNEDKFLVRSESLVEEMRHYVWGSGGSIEHPGVHSDDTSDAGANHGDRVIAAAVAVKFMKEVPVVKTEIPKKIPPNSIAGRILLKKRDDSQSSRKNWM